MSADRQFPILFRFFLRNFSSPESLFPDQDSGGAQFLFRRILTVKQSYMNFRPEAVNELIRSRRSVFPSSYIDKEIPVEIIRQVLESANQRAPGVDNDDAGGNFIGFDMHARSGENTIFLAERQTNNGFGENRHGMYQSIINGNLRRIIEE